MFFLMKKKKDISTFLFKVIHNYRFANKPLELRALHGRQGIQEGGCVSIIFSIISLKVVIYL